MWKDYDFVRHPLYIPMPEEWRDLEFVLARYRGAQTQIRDLEHQLRVAKQDRQHEIDYHREMAIAYRAEGNALRAEVARLKEDR